MTIRPAAFPDIPDLMRIRMSVTENRLSDPTKVQPHHYEQMLRDGAGWVCAVDDVIVGFAIPDPRQGSIWALFVDPAHERKGLGRLLHDTMVRWLFTAGHRTIWLTTDPGTRAERFYRSAGWRPVAITDHGEIRFELTAGSVRQ
jgi:GNAT superfamily N-acetyltransferase